MSAVARSYKDADKPECCWHIHSANTQFSYVQASRALAQHIPCNPTHHHVFMSARSLCQQRAQGHAWGALLVQAKHGLRLLRPNGLQHDSCTLINLLWC
jgi:hypothetical protein